MVSNASYSDMQWLQATLPIKDGGLGIRRVASLALPSFISSAISTTPLQEDILALCPKTLDADLTKMSASWSARFGPVPFDSAASKQASWDLPIIEADKALVSSNLHSPREESGFSCGSCPAYGSLFVSSPDCHLRAAYG